MESTGGLFARSRARRRVGGAGDPAARLTRETTSQSVVGSAVAWLGGTVAMSEAQPPAGRGVAETRRMPVSILPRSGAREEGPARPSSKCLSASYGPEA